MTWKDDFPKKNRYFETINGILYCGDSLEILKEFEDNVISTVITDPPYGLSEHNEKVIRDVLKHWLEGEEDYVPQTRGFMGHEWDAFVPPPALWKEVYRVMKFGATILTFAGTRTQDLMSISMRLAGFEIKDLLLYLFGQGFPKAQDISKMIDKRLGAEREVTGRRISAFGDPELSETHDGRNLWGKKATREVLLRDKPATPEAKKWEGYKTHSLKPAYEPIIMAMKPNEGSYVDNALKWGVAGLNIDEVRIPTKQLPNPTKRGSGIHKIGNNRLTGWNRDDYNGEYMPNKKGRYPANIILDEESAKMLDKQSKTTKSNKVSSVGGFGVSKHDYGEGIVKYERGYEDRGGASRFFYVAKAGKDERMVDGKLINDHPTLKPLKLIEYLVKLTKMPNENQVYLDLFIGSGTTAIACEMQNRKWIGIEKEKKYCDIAVARLMKFKHQKRLTEFQR